MIGVQTAIEAARKHVKAAHWPKDVAGLRCDERVWDDVCELWKIVVSFYPEEFQGDTSTLTKLEDLKARTFKVVLVEPFGGTVLLYNDWNLWVTAG